MSRSMRLRVVFCLTTLSALYGITGCRNSSATHPQQIDSVGKPSGIPLIDAADTSDLNAVNSLLRNGVDVDDVDKGSYTALHHAAHCGDIRVVRALLAGGANVNAQSRDGVTPLVYSIDMMCAQPAITLALIQAGADVNLAPDGDDSALLVATTESSNEVVRRLLERGANVNRQDDRGNTPLHLAVENGLTDRVALLLQYGAQVDLRNAQGQTPLDLTDTNHPEIRDLLEKGSRRQ